MNYLFTPLNTHFDGGLGITASQFSVSADKLHGRESFLPKCYLKRHAIELFLKSFILIIHRKFSLPFGENFSLYKPGVFTNNKWKSLSNTHNLLDLYLYFLKVYSEVKKELPESICWDFPEKIKKNIKLINGYDPKSTYFRYPNSSNDVQDSKKSIIQEENFESIRENSQKSGEPYKTLLVVDDDYNIQQSFNLNANLLPEISKALNEVCDLFNGVHAGLRVVLANGN